MTSSASTPPRPPCLLVSDPAHPGAMERVASYLMNCGIDFEMGEDDQLLTEIPVDCGDYCAVVVLWEDLKRHRERLQQFTGFERLQLDEAYANPMQEVERDARWPWIHLRHRRTECRLLPQRVSEVYDERRLEARLMWVGALQADDPMAMQRWTSRPDAALFNLAARTLLNVDEATLTAWNDSTFLAWIILYETWQRTGDRAYLETIARQADIGMRRGLPPVCSQDDAAPCGPLLLAARELRRQDLWDFALQRMRTYLAGPRHEGALTCYLGDEWLRTDAVGISLPGVAIAGAATGDATMFDAVYQSHQAMRRHLKQPDGMLWYQSVFRGQISGPWARGMAWAAFGLGVVLEYWPTNDPRRAEIAKSFRELCAGFLPYQDELGFWHHVLDEPATPRETSATYLITRSYAWGLRRGLLDTRFNVPMQRGWHALKMRCFQGRMTGVVEATSISARRQYYRDRRLNTDPKHLTLTSRFILDMITQLPPA